MSVVFKTVKAEFGERTARVFSQIKPDFFRSETVIKASLNKMGIKMKPSEFEEAIKELTDFHYIFMKEVQGANKKDKPVRYYKRIEEQLHFKA